MARLTSAMLAGQKFCNSISASDFNMKQCVLAVITRDNSIQHKVLDFIVAYVDAQCVAWDERLYDPADSDTIELLARCAQVRDAIAPFR